MGQEEEDKIIGRNLGRSLWKVSLGFILARYEVMNKPGDLGKRGS